jgi:hypothetical protein
MISAQDRHCFADQSQGEAGFLWFFDYDGSGDVDGLDMAQFNPM